ncbi:MAG: NAD(P)-dependent oxidoreductase [Pirellulales bacterium]
MTGRARGGVSVQRGTIGVVGLGLLGSAIVERLVAAGFLVFGYDIDPARMDSLEKAGLRRAQSPGALAADVDHVLLCLPDSDVVATVVSQMGRLLRPGQVVVDTTTGDPVASVSVAQKLAHDGVDYLDATVGGSSSMARNGQAIAMVGGRRSVFQDCQDLLSSFARQSFYLGSWGSGARMKLVFNLVLGLNRAALAEGLAFAGRLGLDQVQALEVLMSSATYSRAMDSKGRKMIDGHFTPEARLSQHLKDVRLILASGERDGAKLPFSSLHRELLQRLAAAGLGDADNCAIIEAFR